MADNPKRVLRADRDQNFVRFGAYSSTWQRARADIVDKLHIVSGCEIACHKDEIFSCQRTPGAIAPCGEVKQSLIHLAVEKRVAVFPPVERFANGFGYIEAGAQFGRPVDGGIRCLQEIPVGMTDGRRRGYVIGTARTHFQIALRYELLIGQRYSETGY